MFSQTLNPLPLKPALLSGGEEEKYLYFASSSLAEYSHPLHSSSTSIYVTVQ